MIGDRTLSSPPELIDVGLSVWEPLRKDLKRCFVHMAPRGKDDGLQKYKDSSAAFSAAVPVIHDFLLANPHVLSQMSTPGYFKRSVFDLKLPIARDSKGRVYVVLKNKNQPCVFARGTMKVLYYAIRLPSTEFPQTKMLAWAKMSFDKQSPVGLARDEINNELSARQYFAADERILQIFQVFEYMSKEQRKAGILMELCEGDLVQKMYREKGQLQSRSEQEGCWNIMEDLFGVLVRMEELRVLHRDLKPGNIYYTHDDTGKIRGKVADFGYFSSPEKKTSLLAGNILHRAPEYYAILDEIRVNLDHEQHYLQKIAEYKAAEPISTGQEQLGLLPASSSSSTPTSNWTVQRTRCEKGLAFTLSNRDGFDSIVNHTITEVWSAGLILFALRFRCDARSLFVDNEVVTELKRSKEDLKTEFKKIMSTLSQQHMNNKLGIEAGVTSEDQVRTLQDLNLFMLTVDPDQRPSAKVCLRLLQQLRSQGCSFS